MELKFEVNNTNYINIKEVLKCEFGISDRLLTRLKKYEKIFLNNIPTFINHNIKNGDIISVNLDFEEESENIIPKQMNLNIIYEDECMLIINKPFGIPVHPSILHFEDSLSNGVMFYFNSLNFKRKIRPVNRLDKDTSGIVIFAKNEYIQESLIKQMKNNNFKKEYYAILNGILENNSGTIDAAISRKAGSIIEREINENGERAITHYELIKKIKINNQNFSLVKFILETGRTHQIRLHSKYIGHPILGDSLYGKSSELISRQALHAYKITFFHPVTHKLIVLEINLPNDMSVLISK